MTIYKAMESLQGAIDGHETRTQIYNLAIQALEEKATREYPQPLTLDELRQMDGQPVWVDAIGCPDLGAWHIVRRTANYGLIACGDTTKCTYNESGGLNLDAGAYYPIEDANLYGETWLAYRYPPKEVQA